MAAVAAAKGRVALVAGATGLVGREVLAVLLADKSYSKVICVGRRALPLQHPKLVQHTVDFKAVAPFTALPHVDDVFIALGTTIKVAGSQAAFRAVDFEAIVAVARAGRAHGATKLGVVSAMGADPNSGIFYNRVKGEMEQALAHMGFKSLVMARPSLLAGDREALEQSSRLGERLGLLATRWLNPLIPNNYRSIQASDVAKALVKAVQSGKPGVQVLLSGEMQGS
ncbi:MAG: nucleoside-diphosphate sugar epimerase [Burkholderiales bacterium RIFCSPLOWO2_12_FULL_61_40]|nr:MAG: nucleoside-diphosphate sugar epimerase [Burkholderiales bacterium RIFCSPLOWO2_12_FULL_61_40]